ncbi:uncharacterized protein LJ206_007765 isoform 2-T2 [Theristicus caerulescens]
MFVFLVPLNRPKEERKARFCVTATPGRSRRSGAAPRPCPGMLALGGNRSRPPSSRSNQGSGSLPPECPPPPPAARPSLPGREGGGGGGPHPGRASRSVAASARRPGKRLAWSLFFPLTPQPGPAAAADLWQDFCSGREGKKAIDFNRISPQTLLNRVKTRTKKIHCINILPKKGRFALTPSTGSSFVAIYSMRQSNLEKIHLSSLTTFWCNFREVYCLFMWKSEEE